MTLPPAIGDKIQWTINGQDQFTEPPAILGRSSDGRYCFVKGTKAGLPIDQITVVERKPPTVSDIAAWLRLVVEPGSVVELRALHCVDNPKYPAFTVAGWFDHDHLDELAKAAMEWTGKAEGCYVTINPYTHALLARAANRIIKRPKNTTSDADIVRRVGLVFDADPGSTCWDLRDRGRENTGPRADRPACFRLDRSGMARPDRGRFRERVPCPLQDRPDR